MNATDLHQLIVSSGLPEKRPSGPEDDTENRGWNAFREAVEQHRRGT